MTVAPWKERDKRQENKKGEREEKERERRRKIKFLRYLYLFPQRFEEQGDHNHSQNQQLCYPW